MGVGRNEPCPCGSGKKHKRCCLAPSHADPGPAASIRAVERLEAGYRVQAFRYLDRRLGKHWDDEATEIFTGGGDAERDDLDMMVAWILYHYEVDGAGATPHDLFREERASRLNAEERGWGDAQRQAWLSVWEALCVNPAQEIQMRDLLTGQQRNVWSVSGAEIMSPGWGLLGRVVDWQGRSYLVGCHDQPLPREYLSAALAELADGLGLQPGGLLEPDGLRGEEATLKLLEAWEECAGRMYTEGGFLSELRNTDAERLVLVRRLYAFKPADRVQILRRLARLEGCRLAQEGRETVASFCRDGDTLLGSLAVRTAELELQVNSLERDARLSASVEGACRGLLRLLERDVTDPERALSRGTPRRR